jgi:hypothetical protein
LLVSESSEQQVERANERVAFTGNRTARITEDALADSNEFLRNHNEWLAFHLDAWIETVSEGVRAGPLKRCNHHRIETVDQEIALKSNQKRLPLAAAGKRVRDNVELFHRRSQQAGFVR